jgi:hypothetical protein
MGDDDLDDAQPKPDRQGDVTVRTRSMPVFRPVVSVLVSFV